MGKVKPTELVEQRVRMRAASGTESHREEQKPYGKMCTKWWTLKAARALDRSALTAPRDAGKNRAIPAQLEVREETLRVRTDWPAAMAKYYERKCNRNVVTDREHADRLSVLLVRGNQQMSRNSRLPLLVWMRTWPLSLYDMTFWCRDGSIMEHLQCLLPPFIVRWLRLKLKL